MKIIGCLLFLLLAGTAFSQSIKIKIASVTDADGEEVIAFETGDTTTILAGGGVSVAKFEVVKIKKLRSTSTNELFKRSISGNVTADVTFEFYDTGQAMYYKIALKDVVVTHFSYLSPECSGCSKLYHQVWFNYGKIEWTDVATGNTTRYNLQTRAFY